MVQSQIRNFCIIAHIDHGKSTLADRLLEMTSTVEKRQMQEQFLDSNPIERERGITIKLAPVRMLYQYAVGSGQWAVKKIPSSNCELQTANYILNLIDTPGHVDFNYEVSRSLAACEGAILVVDATQGVQAQTLANLNLARKQNLVVIPVVNKIDLPNADVHKVTEQLMNLGFEMKAVISISAKTGTNIDQVLKATVETIPPPQGDPDKPLRALVFSSQYDVHKGVVIYVRVVDGFIGAGPAARQPHIHPQGEPRLWGPPARVTRLQFMASGVEVEPVEIGYFRPKMEASSKLLTGEVGYIATGLKDVALAKVGDTITIKNYELRIQNQGKRPHPDPLLRGEGAPSTLENERELVKPLPGYQEPKPMVFLGLFPIQSEEINQVRDALLKLRLADSAFTFRPIHSQALGHGFHCGFLGLLHAEVVQERLSREFGLSLLATPPTVEYLIRIKDHRERTPPNPLFPKEGEFSSPLGKGRKGGVDIEGFTKNQSPVEFPDPSLIEEAREPVMEVTVFAPKRYVGSIMQLAQDKRSEFVDLGYSGAEAGEEATLAQFTYMMPLFEMIIDFFDRLKSITEGYASLDYKFFDYQTVELVKLDILLNHEKVDAFSQVVVRERAEGLGRSICEKLKEVIPRQQFAIPIQAAIGGKIIAREDVKAFRKDVTQKLYGGDRTRKDKLLEAQKKGKKKMKMVGKVEIPQEAFLKVFKSG